MNAFDKIIGYEPIKKDLARISDVLSNKEVYKKLGVSSPNGLLLYGNPGVGKTLMASALIEASGRKAFICRKDKPDKDFVNAIRKTFKDAEKAAPSIVFLDDMDKFANGDVHHKDAEEYVTVQSCIDERKGKEVFVLATANCLETLPASLLRAGRFDRIIEVENPRGNDAVKIISHYIKNKKFVDDIDPMTVTRIMNGHTCADLEMVINEAGLYAGFERSNEITMDHFMKACLHTIHDIPMNILNKENIDNQADAQWARIVYHEAGHAAVAEILNPGIVTLVSAYNHYERDSGFTAYYPESYISLDEYYQSRIITSLGGMAAVEQKFGIYDIGAAQDLDRAFHSTRRLITDVCASGFHLHCDDFENDSQDLKARIEQAVAIEIERYYRKAKEILTLNHEFLEAIASELFAKGVLTVTDIQRIKNDCKCVLVSIG